MRPGGRHPGAGSSRACREVIEGGNDEGPDDDDDEDAGYDDAAPTSPSSSSVELVSLLNASGEGGSRESTHGPPALLSGQSAVSTSNREGSWTRRRSATLASLAIAAAVTVAALFTTGPSVPTSLEVNDAVAFDQQRIGGGGVVHLTGRQLEQVRSFRSGRGMIVHLHVTHHAGTTFCHALGAAAASAATVSGAAATTTTTTTTARESTSSNGTTHATPTSATLATGAPPFACRIDRKIDTLHANVTSDRRFSSRVPWWHNETQSMIDLLRPYYHMVSFEFGYKRPSIRLQNTDWDNPNVVSVFLTRHPLERMLSGDAYVGTHYAILKGTASHQQWWDFANMTAHGYTDNVMLRVLSNDPHCCQGADTPRERFDEAVELLRRFTFILDTNCLDEGMVALANLLGLEEVENASMRHVQRLHHVHPADVASRYPYRDVYDHLVRKNHLDLELYRWTQRRALVQCIG
jgi:hypothetical protein